MAVRNLVARDLMRAGRGLLGWSQSELADAAGLNVNQIKNIERGALDPRSSMLAKIEEAFRQAGVIFLDRDDNRTEGPGVRFAR